MSEAVALSASSGVEPLDARFTELRLTPLGVARSLVGQDSADDVVHDSYLRAGGRISQLRDPRALDAWLSRIVVATAFNYHRRRRGLIDRLPLFVRRGSAPTPDLGLDELIDLLPARERTVLVLQNAYGYHLDEIARMVGTSHTNTRTIAFRARRRLATAWRQADR